MQNNFSRFLKFVVRRNSVNFTNPLNFSTAILEPKVIGDKKFLTASCISDEINIRLVKSNFKNVPMVKELTLPIEANKLTYAGEYNSADDEKRFFIFSDGVISFWNMNFKERSEIIELTKPFQSNAIMDYVKEEDDLIYCYHTDKTKINKEVIYLKFPQNVNQYQILIEQQLAVSEALSQSVKLGIFELQFQQFSKNINVWIDQLKSSSRWRIREREVLKKTGELFTMRHKINVSSHLTEVPDFYWEKPDLEQLFNQVRLDLSIYQRTKVLNEKLNLYCELTEILRNHIASMHSTRLEIMIIVLILIEVIFEFISYGERKMYNKMNYSEDQ